MLRSLRARLLAWYSLVLLIVLATFAAVALWSVWRSSVRNLDARLGATASRLARALQADGTGRYELNLADDDFSAFDGSAGGPYFVIWTTGGALIDRSDTRVQPPFPAVPQARTWQDRREVVVRGDRDTLVLVGQPLAGARSDLWGEIVAFAAAAVVALLLALAGGWFLVGRALAPIGRIAHIAEQMSESNLGLRIDVARTEDELGSVATALNRAFDRLQDAFERQTRFTADASHELRTPLASQMAELEWALARRRSEADYENTLRVCMKAAQRMQAVVEGLLTLARADGGAGPVQPQSVDLGSLIEEVANGFRAVAAQRGVELRVSASRAVVSGDPDRLRELVSNLVSNAVQYSGSGARVACSTLTADDRVSIEVSDTGPGIEPEDLPHIFDRFYRAGTTRSRASGGAGLGLAISKWIAESHGGQIRGESTPGHGARFTVELPAASDAAAPSGHAHDAA